MGERATSKRSPKRRGPAKKYAPETLDWSPVKKPRRKAVTKRRAKAATQVSTAAMPTAVAIPEYPTPSASPLDGKDERSQISVYFKNYSSRFMEDYDRLSLENEH